MILLRSFLMVGTPISTGPKAYTRIDGIRDFGVEADSLKVVSGVGEGGRVLRRLIWRFMQACRYLCTDQ